MSLVAIQRPAPPASSSYHHNTKHQRRHTPAYYPSSFSLPKLSPAQLEAALHSAQEVIDQLKTVLERFDDDLAKLKDRSRRLDFDILAAQKRMEEHAEWAEQEKLRMASDGWLVKEKRRAATANMQ